MHPWRGMAQNHSHTQVGRCARCEQPVHLGVRGPAVLLAVGIMHWDCRVAQTREDAQQDQERREQSHARRVEQGRRLAAARHTQEEGQS